MGDVDVLVPESAACEPWSTADATLGSCSPATSGPSYEIIITDCRSGILPERCLPRSSHAPLPAHFTAREREGVFVRRGHACGRHRLRSVRRSARVMNHEQPAGVHRDPMGRDDQRRDAECFHCSMPRCSCVRVTGRLDWDEVCRLAEEPWAAGALVLMLTYLGSLRPGAGAAPVLNRLGDSRRRHKCRRAQAASPARHDLCHRGATTRGTADGRATDAWSGRRSPPRSLPGRSCGATGKCDIPTHRPGPI